MEWTQIASIIASVLAGIATCIPLAVKLVEYVKQAVQEKNWQKLLELALKYMGEAEEKFEDGASREDWVVAMIKIAAEEINYPFNEAAVRQMIRDLCAMSKKVNAPAPLPESTEN